MKSAQLIEYENVLYVPRPTSVFAGHARDIWIKNCLGKSPHIAHPDFWEWLAERGEKKVLTETASGFEIQAVHND